MKDPKCPTRFRGEKYNLCRPCTMKKKCMASSEVQTEEVVIEEDSIKNINQNLSSPRKR